MLFAESDLSRKVFLELLIRKLEELNETRLEQKSYVHLEGTFTDHLIQQSDYFWLSKS